MPAAPRRMAWSRKALNLISALQSTSGLGVRPAEYSRRNSVNTRSLYSAAKFTASMSTPTTSATLAASSQSWRAEQYSVSSSSSQFFMNRPTTSNPCCFSSHADTDESTPPDMPTTTRAPAAMRSPMGNGLVDDLDPVAHRRLCAALQMCDAADIGRDDALGQGFGDRLQLAITQGLGQLRLCDRIRAGRTAAQMRVGERLQIETQVRQQALGHRAQALPVLQGARRMKRGAPWRRAHAGPQLGGHGGEEFRHVLDVLDHAGGLVRIRG